VPGRLTVSMMSRRKLLKSAALCACAGQFLQTLPSGAQTGGKPTLKSMGARTGRLIGVFGGAYLPEQPILAEVVAREYSMIGDGNDLKFTDLLRPTPDTYNFGPGDIALDWAHRNNLVFRGHCLLWWNVLPKWFQSHVTPANAKQVMVDHITTVVKHYAGRVYSWDVVNEAIYDDNRPDGLRRKPWLDPIGPEYIDIAFHTAAAADPNARLILNECFIEHDTPTEIGRRVALLALATRLKIANVPISGIGIQGHLRGNTPIDKPGMTTFLKQVHDLGLGIMITELDFDDVGVPGPMIDKAAEQKYVEFIDLVGPFATSISFQRAADKPNSPKRPDWDSSRTNLFDVNCREKPFYKAVAQALERLLRPPAS
jgi:endo-1,4-beta-xylanase